MTNAPTTDEILARTARGAAVEFDALKRAERGMMLDEEKCYVEPGDPESPHRFSLLPGDVAEELASVEARLARPTSDDAEFRYRLAVRRLRDANNSAGLSLPSIKARLPFNPAFMNPEDMLLEGLGEGDPIEVTSKNGSIHARVEADEALRPGVVSITHGFGDLPRKNVKYDDVGVSTNALLSLDDEARETINAMPHMTGIAVAIRRAEPD